MYFELISVGIIAKSTFLAFLFDHLQSELKLFLEFSQSKLSSNYLEFLSKLLKEDMTSLKLEK